jgi:hypothetical protein
MPKILAITDAMHSNARSVLAKAAEIQASQGELARVAGGMTPYFSGILPELLTQRLLDMKKKHEALYEKITQYSEKIDYAADNYEWSDREIAEWARRLGTGTTAGGTPGAGPAPVDGGDGSDNGAQPGPDNENTETTAGGTPGAGSAPVDSEDGSDDGAQPGSDEENENGTGDEGKDGGSEDGDGRHGRGRRHWHRHRDRRGRDEHGRRERDENGNDDAPAAAAVSEEPRESGNSSDMESFFRALFDSLFGGASNTGASNAGASGESVYSGGVSGGSVYSGNMSGGSVSDSGASGNNFNMNAFNLVLAILKLLMGSQEEGDSGSSVDGMLDSFTDNIS